MTTVDSIVEASISDLSDALSSNTITSVELVAKYLLRIAAYDTRRSALNSIPLLNEDVFMEAAAADDRRASGQSHGLLDGIPFTVKDSYKVRGMTVASGSVAFQSLIANEDAFTVKALKDAGAVLIGKTNMCPMAYGGMLRGVYGRAESPYNQDYLPAAFGSGSSHGSGVSVAASFAAFGMGEETVSSGRSPASNNALIAYTPSRGLISIRGNWPLYPTCDVVVPHTRKMSDLFCLLDVLTQPDHNKEGDFWRDQPFLSLPSVPITAADSERMKDADHLEGKRIVVPRMYIEQTVNGPFISPAVTSLWNQTKIVFEAAGAKIVVAEDFPVMTAYESPPVTDDSTASSSTPCLPKNWNATERGELIAEAWEDFLFTNRDPNVSSLIGIEPSDIFPQMPRDDPQVKFTEPSNSIRWNKLAEYVKQRPNYCKYAKSTTIYNISNLDEASSNLEKMRYHFFENWMKEHEYDYVVFPAAGDVAKADADINYDSAEHAWKNGVKYSHGNRALRHLGIPSVTVPMGILEDKQMPMGLTFLGRAYDDVCILSAAYAFEQKSSFRRTVPPLTPPLKSDTVTRAERKPVAGSSRVQISVSKCLAHSKGANDDDKVSMLIEGTLVASTATITDNQSPKDSFCPKLDIFIDGTEIPEKDFNATITQAGRAGDIYQAQFSYVGSCSRPPTSDKRNRVVGKIARDSIMVMIIARSGGGKPSGYLKLMHVSDIVT